MSDSQLLLDQLQVIEDDCQRLLKVLASPLLPLAERQALEGRFKIALSPLLMQVIQLRQVAGEAVGSPPWHALKELRMQASQLQEDALVFTGGISISQAEMFQPVTAAARQYLAWLAGLNGVAWSPVVVAGSPEADNLPEELVVESGPDDRLVRLPLLGFDLWRLPLLAERWGYYTVKSGHIGAITAWVNGQAESVQALLSEDPPGEAELVAFLPEVRTLADGRALAASATDFGQQHGDEVHRLVQRQKVHFWRLAGVAMAAYLASPAYAMALTFLELDPSRPGLEGERSPTSRYQPSDLKRAALVFQSLRAADRLETPPHKSSGPYSETLSLLEDIWEQALEEQNGLNLYQQVQREMQPWGEALLDLFDTYLGIPRQEAAQRWHNSIETYLPLLEGGSSSVVAGQVSQVLEAAWWCRVLHPQRTAAISKDASHLLSGSQPVNGLLAPAPPFPQEAARLVHSRIFDLEGSLRAADAVFRSPALEPGERELVSGRFYRLLSDLDYSLRNARRFLDKGGSSGSLLAVLAQQQVGLLAFQQELLDFLGGVLIRKANLDEHACRLADGLLGGFSRLSGVAWSGRAIPGQNPLLSQATELVHLRFPDWDIWNLPLMAHEFGHVTAFATPAFERLLVQEQPSLLVGHPQVAGWTEDQKQEYLEGRRRHLHEFFADAFALYVQGPAFACDAILLNFNPAEAYQSYGSHPSHAERVELLLKVLKEMNQQEKSTPHSSGPYADIHASLRASWDGSVTTTPDEFWTFHKLKAIDLGRKFFALLDRYFRWGAQYPAEAWLRAEKYAPLLPDEPPDFSAESLRSLLGIAWAARWHHPDLYKKIGNLVRNACLAKL